MAKSLLTCIGVVFLMACSTAPVSEPDARQMSATTIDDGKATYLDHCSVCHETGMLGAPIVGDPSSWEKRSHLWQAVLMEHAKTGYLDMPAKGGRHDISDAAAEAATEYMLEATFADMPAD